VEKELTEKEQADHRVWLDKVLAKAEAKPPMGRLLQALEDLNGWQPLNDDARDILRTSIVPLAKELMARLQAADPMEAWKNHPEEARGLSELIAAYVDLICSGPPFGSDDLFQRRELDQEAQAWRPWNATIRRRSGNEEDGH
jgi:hypothetical protein